MKKKFLTVILLVVASVFSFSNVNAGPAEDNISEACRWAMLSPLDQNLWFYESVNYIWEKMLNKIEKLVEKFIKKLDNKWYSDKKKKVVLNKILDKIQDVRNNELPKKTREVLYVLYQLIKEEIYKIDLKLCAEEDNNSSEILDNIFWNIEENSVENNSNVSSNNNIEQQTYKIFWEPISYNITTSKNTLIDVKLWKFEISSSDWKYVKLNSFWIKISNAKWWKLPSVKYVKLYTDNWLFLRNFELRKIAYNYAVFYISPLDLKPWKYIIKWDISDIPDNLILETKLDWSYSSSKFIYKQVNFWKVSIKKEKIYKIIGYNHINNLFTKKKYISDVKLWTFNINSSDWKPVLIKKIIFRYIWETGKKMPSIKYLKLIDNNWNFIKKLKFESSSNIDIKFSLENVNLKEWDYTIIWDVSDLEENTITHFDIAIEKILDSSHKYIYVSDWDYLWEVNIKQY